MMKPAIKVIALLVLVGFAAALGGCVPADCKGCRWWSYSDGYKYTQNKQIIKPFAEKMEKEKEGKEIVRVAVIQPASTPKEFNLKVVRAAGVELPELTDETLAKIKEIIIEWLGDNSWTVKETAPFSLTIALTYYKEGSLSGRILRSSVKLRTTIDEKDKAEIRGSLLLSNGSDIFLDMDLPRTKTAENGLTEGKQSSVSMKIVQKVFAQIIVDTLNDYREGKIISNE